MRYEIDLLLLKMHCFLVCFFFNFHPRICFYREEEGKEKKERERGRERGRKEGREGGMKGGREERRKGGREGGEKGSFAQMHYWNT